MKQINLRDYYPNYQEDTFIDVPDELADEMIQWDRNEAAYQRKKFRYHAQYSLDCEDGIERCIEPLSCLATKEVSIAGTQSKRLYQALCMLSAKQALRIIAIFFMGISQQEIAVLEGISRQAVSKTILVGMSNLTQALSAIP